MAAGGRPARSGRDARGGGGHPRSRAGPDPARADAGVAVHVLPRCRRSDGRRSRGVAAHGAAGAALRRRASLELRGVRGSRPAARLRPQRLRRDAARPVRVGRQAARRELRRRRPGSPVQPPAARADHPRRGAGLPGGDARVRRDAGARRLVLPPRRRGARDALGDAWHPEGDQALRAQRRESACEGQHASLRPAYADGRRQTADHQ